MLLTMHGRGVLRHPEHQPRALASTSDDRHNRLGLTHHPARGLTAPIFYGTPDFSPQTFPAASHWPPSQVSPTL